MRTAETILNIIQDRGKRQLPLDDVYRQLYNPAMYLRSYAKLYRNDGAMTPGITAETVKRSRKVLVQWQGLQLNAFGFVPLSIA
jgi:hypothetical protein